MSNVEYDTSAKSGKRFAVTVDGRRYAKISAVTAEVVLRKAGLGCVEARHKLAWARIAPQVAS